VSPIDINNLPTVSETVELPDYDNYVDASEFAPPFPEGIYTFKTSKLEVEKFDQATGVVSFSADHDAFDDTGNKVGSISFDRFSTKVFDRSGVKVSMAADQLRAYGIQARPASPREWADVLMAAASNGDTFKAATRWEGYCGHKGSQHESKYEGAGKARHLVSGDPATELRGERKFPVNGGGEHVPEAPCGVCGQAIQARSKIDRRLPKVS
jgi:hypothetical protein